MTAIIVSLAVLLLVAAVILVVTALFLQRSTRRALPSTPAAEVPPQARAVAEHLVAEGRPIEAIKHVREHTGWSLREAKEYVEGLRHGHPPATTG